MPAGSQWTFFSLLEVTKLNRPEGLSKHFRPGAENHVVFRIREPFLCFGGSAPAFDLCSVRLFSSFQSRVSENSLLNRPGVSTTFPGSPRFSVGDHVRISARFPVGHYRAPMYVPGKVGRTLCSCYPRPILGLPPDCYKSKQYRARAVREPRAVLAEFGTPIPAGKKVREGRRAPISLEGRCFPLRLSD